MLELADVVLTMLQGMMVCSSMLVAAMLLSVMSR